MNVPLKGLWFVTHMIHLHGRDAVYAEYNGIGAEWMGRRVRAWLTRAFVEFVPAAFIHDIRKGFKSGIGSRAANKELLWNCRQIAAESDRPRFLKFAAYVFYFACQAFGGKY